jgi:hypothetical protein
MTEIELREGYETSFAGLFTQAPDLPAITGIQIPLVQRDYAQGRHGAEVEEIRNTFLDVLHDALIGGDRVGLDFVYGDVVDATLLPLDGQQRLTTLFLLHWYLCFRTGRLPAEQDWHRFSYDTRQSARMFCERLVENPPLADEPVTASWIVNQPWYLYVWGNDPTISSMLTMIGAIEAKFATDAHEAAWTRLTDPASPAISFQLLPIKEVGAGDELYIKMNSRGKPLTAFETFKGRFEQTVSWSDRLTDLKHNIDGAWSDLLWHLRGEDNLIDGEFLHYVEFVVEICEWRDDVLETGHLHQRTQKVFAPENERARKHLDFLFAAFDWTGESEITATFADLLSTEHVPIDGDGRARVVLFGTGEVETNLFRGCCERFGETRGRGRTFSLGETLLLYGVLLHRINGTTDLARRLRIIRNLIEASINELRLDNMPKLLRDVEQVVVDGTLDGVSTFNQIQVADERLKEKFFADHPDLLPAAHRLEDDNLLRGTLTAFELDPEVFDQRAQAFVDVFGNRENWPALTGALLATGEYQRRRPSSEGYQFGTEVVQGGDGVWRSLFTGSREALSQTRAVLGELLDGYAASESPVPAYLSDLSSAWCASREESQVFDWRYYLVRYDAMRTGATGIYFGIDAVLGYSLCMLKKTILSGYYRDPFLYAIHLTTETGEAVRDARFRGYPDTARWLRLDASGTGIRSVAAGLALDPPKLPEHRALFDAWCAAEESVHEDGEEFLVTIAQADRDGVLTDTEDRVLRGAAVVTTLVAAGL